MNKKIENMKVGGRILGEVMSELVKYMKPGITELDIEKKATDLIIKKGGQPGFKLVPGYSFTTCISTNDAVVHGIPKNRVLNEGDVVGVDCGVYYNGYHTDMAQTVRLKTKKEGHDEIDHFLEIGEKALYKAIKMAKSGNRIGHISKTIQEIVEGEGYSIVKNLVGHGVGKELHEEPQIPGFLDRKLEKTPILKPGMTIAIEVIYNMGTDDVVYGEGDDWTISTADGSMSGLFERTVLVTEKEPIILTKLKTG